MGASLVQTFEIGYKESFRPQDGNTYTRYKLRSMVFDGDGNDYISPVYTNDPPWNYTEYGTTEPIGFLVQLECDKAENRMVGFGDGPPPPVCYAVWDEETKAAKSDQNKIDSALAVLFKNASTTEGDPDDFDLTLSVIPDTFEGVYWSITADSPDSGWLLNADQPVATFRNPTKGGLYKFETSIPGIPTITSQLWLPVSGPDISANFQHEIDYLNNWKPRYLTNLHARVLKRMNWNQISNSFVYEAHKWNFMKGDIQTIGPAFDYKLVSLSLLQDVCGLANVPVTSNKAMDSSRLVLYGATRPYVTDFAKRNNMGYAMCAKTMGWPDIAILKGPNFALATGNAGAGSWDGPNSIAAYDAGIDIINGGTIKNVMDSHGRSMQNPSMRLSKEWPSDEVANATYIALSANFYNYLENLAGGTP